MMDAPRDPHALPVRETRRLWWLWLLLLCGVCVVGYFVVNRIRHSATSAADAKSGAGRPINVVTQAVQRGDMNIYLEALGTVTALNNVTVRSRVDGQIINIAFTEGQIVHEDDPLVQIDPRPFEVQLTQAQGQLAKDEALLKNAKADLVRYQNLVKQNFSVTQQQVDTQQSVVQQNEGAVKSDQGVIDNATLQISYCNITAPITGRIGLRLVDIGNMVHSSDSTGLLVITQVQPISVVFTIPEYQVSQVLRNGNGGKGLTVDAFDRDNNKLATGSLLAIDNQADVTSGTLRIKASFANENGELFPNQFVNVKLQVDVLHDVTLAPPEAVQLGPDAPFAYVLKPADSTVELRTIEVGPTDGKQTVILKGLSPGEAVVTDGVDKLQQGTKVNARAQAPGPRSTTRPSTRPARGRAGAGAAAATRPARRPATEPAR